VDGWWQEWEGQMRLWTKIVEEMPDCDHAVALRRYAVVDLKVLFISVTEPDTMSQTRYL
jgi:hypothetical protein